MPFTTSLNHVIINVSAEAEYHILRADPQVVFPVQQQQQQQQAQSPLASVSVPCLPDVPHEKEAPAPAATKRAIADAAGITAGHGRLGPEGNGVVALPGKCMARTACVN
jgi:hypothetical protein